MSQHAGNRQVMEMLLAAQFDTGFYRQIEFTPADGSVARHDELGRNVKLTEVACAVAGGTA